MTVFQIKIAMAIEKTGSVSAAAKELNVSQPNASSSIRNLEEEIGYTIFDRNQAGAKITEKGKFFLEHAKYILAENESILDVNNWDKIYRLRLGTINYYPAVEPFLKICEMHRDDAETDFKYYNVSVIEAIEKLDNYELDVVFCPVLRSQVVGLRNACKSKKLAMISLGEMPAVINLRKDHPAALDGRAQNITQGSEALKDYPYISYRNLSEDKSSTGFNDAEFVQSKYIMYVDEVNLRLRMVGATNGFCFGMNTPAGYKDHYNIVAFPVHGISLEMFCLTRNTETEKKEIQEYIELLKEELSTAMEEK